MEIANNQGTAKTVLVQCNLCEVVFEHPRPSKEEIKAFYCDENLWTNSTDAEGRQRSYIREVSTKYSQFVDLVRRIEKRKYGGRLLDVGCGPGLLEKVLDPSRWQVTGIEISDYIAGFGKEQLGTNVINESFELADLPVQHYDVIVMKYVLDHMEEPFEALLKARELIKPNGVFVIADLINIESFGARFFKDGFRLFHPMHFTYFSPKTISYHLKRAGFCAIAIDYPYFKTPYFNFSNISVLLRRIGRRSINKYVLRNNRRVYSPPCYGNMMDIWAIPV